MFERISARTCAGSAEEVLRSSGEALRRSGSTAWHGCRDGRNVTTSKDARPATAEGPGASSGGGSAAGAEAAARTDAVASRQGLSGHARLGRERRRDDLGLDV